VLVGPPSGDGRQCRQLVSWRACCRHADAAVQAQVLPTKRLLLPKGAFIDCTLETALDSQLPG